ncbi:hypothetical protein PN462_10080 [Spirulina sp. CS-785/01]|uniref:hypothetical protein n=1 Tax=Spirulina sp. CS-785/01 TaxID=3021716 RepID=UPI00232FE47F|nr:hypothetical protein [Spirulina sp. CS-785/01]MDB9313445.1 hypothetical protein [Spirulina sp. CS-785/01]
MNNKNQQNQLDAVLMSTVGAGIVTSFAVGQGQSPLVALSITGVAVGFTLLCRKLGVI